MKYSDLQAGMKIRAIGEWCDCWKVGDEFEVYAAKDGEMSIICNDAENGGAHGLESTATDDGDLPEFEPA